MHASIGLLTELRAADLRFTADEAAAVLQAALGTDPARGCRCGVGGPHRRLGGGAAAGRVVAAGATAFVASFTGSHRYVLDYLTEEVLARLTEDDQVANAMVDSNLAQVDWLAGRLPQVEQNAPRPSPPTGPPAHPSRPATSTTSWPRSNTD